ncbi:hypothetical protein Mal4_52690 [Maioricimonas rarisocia]|uniref:Uncharacterized protein n=1 Tax=Maioricimonas rarisocia TaxID=2528026 RepID=A0A517ZEM0_9PLAN|nr:hypothetical protein [Maioricimonas rarisocia]QDU40906.1 hypothetical protein Mal4_52690 [Maioricimonas rarisocia]
MSRNIRTPVRLLPGLILSATLTALLLLVMAANAEAAGGTANVATPGQPAYINPNWPEGTADLVNDPARTHGWNPWFSEWPNDVNHYGYAVESMEDVNRLVQKLAAIKTPLRRVLLAPTDEPGNIGWVSSVPKGNGLAALFSIGDQQRLDQWHSRLPGGKFGVMEFESVPVAVPPTLTLFVSNDIMVLDQLEAPPGVEVAFGYGSGLFLKSNTSREREASEKAKSGDDPAPPPVKGEPVPPELQKVLDRINSFVQNHRMRQQEEEDAAVPPGGD